jgi:hypothetical protein
MSDAPNTKSDKTKRVKALQNHQLDHIDQQIIDLMHDFPRMTDKEIGDVVGLARISVTTRRNCPKFKEKMAELNRAPEEILRASLKDAAIRYIELSKHSTPDHSVREKATKAILTTFGILKNGTITFVDETSKLSDEELTSRAEKLIAEIKKKAKRES